MSNSMLKSLEQALTRKDEKSANSIIRKITNKDKRPETLIRLAQKCLQLEQVKLGAKLFKKALAADPAMATHVMPLVDMPVMLDHFETAKSMVEQAMAVDNNDTELVITLAILYTRAELYPESEAMYLQALDRGDNNYRTLTCMSDLYFKMNRYHDGVATAKIAVELDPNSADANYNAGILCMAANQFNDSVAFLKRVIELDPKHHGAHINLAHIMLKLGMFDIGWQHNEWRFNNPDSNINDLQFPYPKWKGEPVAGKKMVLWTDQGLGDQVMCAFVINKLAAAGCRLSVLADWRLEKIFTENFQIETFYPAVPDQDITIKGAHDFNISFGSVLAFFLRSFEDFGNGDAYIKADSTKVAAYRERLTGLYPGKKLVALGWRGGISSTRKQARLIGLDQWQTILARDDCQLFNLQYDTTEEEKQWLAEHGVVTPDFDLKDDIDEMFEFLSAIDLFISSDNSTVHFAGALGVKVWVLLPFASEWRWFMEEEKAWWYNSMRLFKNAEIDTWGQCLEKVNQALTDFVVEHKAEETAVITPTNPVAQPAPAKKDSPADSLEAAFEELKAKMAMGDYPAVLALCEQLRPHIDNQSMADLYLVQVHAHTQLGNIEAAITDLFLVLDINPANDEVLLRIAGLLNEAGTEEYCSAFLDRLSETLIGLVDQHKDYYRLIVSLFDHIGFTEAGDSQWKDKVFAHFSLPILQIMISQTRVDLALAIESTLFSRYMRTGGDNYEARFINSTRLWYPMMEAMGEKVAQIKQLKNYKGVRYNNNKLAFFIHNESTMAHIGTVFSLLKSYQKRGDCWFDATVYSLAGHSPEMREIFSQYGVKVVNLQELKPGSGYMDRYLLLREILQENQTERLVWVCLTTAMSFAFGLRIAPEQIWFSGSYYRGLINKNIDKRVLNTMLADKIYEGNNEWNVVPFSISNLCKDIEQIAPEVEAIRSDLLGDDYDTIVGVLAREQKIQDIRYLSTVAKILEANERVLFVWTGTTEDPTVTGHLKALGIEQRCRYIGWIDTAVYSHVLDIFLDTLPFPCGLTFYQAMAAAKASVSLRTDDAIAMGIHGQLVAVFESPSEYYVSEQRSAALKQVFGDSGERFLFHNTVENYIESANRLIRDMDFRDSIGQANARLAREFLMDDSKTSEAFDQILLEGREPP